MLSTKNHVFIFIGVAIIGSLLYFSYDPAYTRLFPPCPLFKFTGLYCPGCGSQRAFHDLLHGDIIQAAGHNLLFVLALPLVGFSALVVSHNIFFEKKWKQAVFNSRSFAVTVLFVVLLFWMLRNLPLKPFSLLAP
jgi:hypothetical protein